MVGSYDVVAQAVAARVREFGVRAALGATPGSLVRVSVANGARHATVGLILGAVGALAVTQLLSGMLYGVAPRDPTTFGAAIAATGLAALAACWLPARRAARADPAATLRNE